MGHRSWWLSKKRTPNSASFIATSADGECTMCRSRVCFKVMGSVPERLFSGGAWGCGVTDRELVVILEIRKVSSSKKSDHEWKVVDTKVGNC